MKPLNNNVKQKDHDRKHIMSSTRVLNKILWRCKVHKDVQIVEL